MRFGYSEEEINQLLDKFVEMCQNHPEICPHEYRADSCGYRTDGKFENRYICTICGHKKSEEYEL